jgi:hypothetical protein
MTTMITVRQYNDGIDGDEMLQDTADVKHALELLAKEKRFKLDAEIVREEAVEIIENFHYSTGARQFSIAGLGTCTAYAGSSTRFDKSSAAIELAKRGVDPNLIADVWEKCTKVTYNKKITVRFKPEE